MRLHSVIDRALADPGFAADLAGKAARVRDAAGATDPAYEALLAEFADGPEELGRLLAAPASFQDGTTTATATTTTTTITTTTTLACSTTTTTSTSSVTTTTTDAVVLRA